MLSYMMPNFLVTFGASRIGVADYHMYWQIITAMFCHSGLLHLVCNMMSLKSVGDVVENMYGTKKMLIIYLTTGIIATIESITFQNVTTVGASGAICGLIGAYMAQLKRYNGLDMETAIRIVSPIVIMSLLPGIDMIAHVAGLIGGYLIGRWIAQ